MKSKKILVVIILLLLAVLMRYSLPKAKYTGTGIITQLKMPESLSHWKGKDVTLETGINEDLKNYDHMSEAIAYRYANKEGKTLLFIVLDAQTFHHPKVCFTGAGFTTEELLDTEFPLKTHTLKAHTVHTTRGEESFFNFYWVVIDRKVANEWIEQKFKQFFSALLGQKKIGLMIRIDIPAKGAGIEDAKILAKQFIDDLSLSLQPEHADYILGKK
jgi:EpsI family protein